MPFKPGHGQHSRFVKGQSGNPGGRPKAIVEVYRAAREYTIEAFQTLATIMRNEKATDSARVTAATVLLERGWGKAPQTVTLADNRNLKDLSDAELIAVALGTAEDRSPASGPDASRAPSDPDKLH